MAEELEHIDSSCSYRDFPRECNVLVDQVKPLCDNSQFNSQGLIDILRHNPDIDVFCLIESAKRPGYFKYAVFLIDALLAYVDTKTKIIIYKDTQYDIRELKEFRRQIVSMFDSNFDPLSIGFDIWGPVVRRRLI